MEGETLKEKILRWFSEWARLKPHLHFSESGAFPKRREIWWAHIGQNIGVEINGKSGRFERPVLIVRVFNKDFVLVVPISSKAKEGQYYHSFTNQSGKRNVVVLSQIKSISSKRLMRKVAEMGGDDFTVILIRLKEML
ncbi:MAG: toxin-antitoxin system protein [Candidatus Taylorbacteria bacterium CG11_big_fil_rev_8_21_14_0_20_46_11]|uniref:Toxin-antitoxin system protein n=1 Tax=Candidatus Taylorbacteria bacterium CG11_big_fil_rev_8_21_14_0_20_46_11 TaxID=1975025 RepID=A0A2H0KC77_9BACT|nr:MAG: toxin-antitoxin system protein [Candidatus Taylorbacteria bacterium CG11_big_fil_rev_8_21_14_0_20_46_11]